MLSVAACGVEEDKVGRRVVQEARKRASKPEVHGVDRLAVTGVEPS